MTMSFFNKGNGKKKKNENPLKNVKNPFAQVAKAAGGKRAFKGEGNSLGGTKPGKILTNFIIENPGPVGVKVSAYCVVCNDLLCMVPCRCSCASRSVSVD